MTPQALTPEQLAELRELDASATAGPWHRVFGGRKGARSEGIIADAIEGLPVAWTSYEGLTEGANENDATFIAAMRNALRPLLDELESLRAEVVRLRRVISGTHQAYCDQTRERHAPECLLFEVEEQP